MTKTKIFNSFFGYVFGAIVLVELISFFSKLVELRLENYWVQAVFCSLFFIVALILSFKKLEWGVMVAITELIIGSKGHLLAIEVGHFAISIRMAIFVAVMSGWVVYLVKKKKTSLIKSFIFPTFIMLLSWVAIATVWAIMQGRSWGLVFADMNAWMYFLYLGPFLETIGSKINFERLMQLISAGILSVGLKTISVLYVFSHWDTFPIILYKWVRDTGVGEITLLNGNFYRIFFQSHIYSLIGAVLAIAFIFFLTKKQIKNQWQIYLLAIVSLAATYLCLSRSNWIGLAAGLLFIAIVYFVKFKLKKILMSGGKLILLGLGTVALIYGTLYFPWPTPNIMDTDQMLSQRLQMDEAAASSRWSQLEPLGKQIIRHPIIGWGWGKQVTYVTQDPRIVQQTGDGEYTTHAFEWGYLDIILKMGLVGLTIYLFWFGQILKRCYKVLKKKEVFDFDNVFIVGSTVALIAVFAVHMFSPYLNHPLGIGYLLIVTSIINNK